jgi:uncharacterized protein YukE
VQPRTTFGPYTESGPPRPPGPAGSAGSVGADVERIAAGAGPALEYLSRTARHLGIPDPVQEYFGPVVGRWHDLHEQARQWRRAAHAIEELGDRITSPLGNLDAVWEGTVADSFIEHMRQVGAAGKSVSDAMSAMAEILDRTADAVRQLVTDLIELLSGGADRVSFAMVLPVDGEQLARRQLVEVRGYGRRVFESVREILDAFAETCDGLEAGQPFAGVRIATAFPRQTWSFRPELPAPNTDTAGAAAMSAGGAGSGVGSSGVAGLGRSAGSGDGSGRGFSGGSGLGLSVGSGSSGSSGVGSASGSGLGPVSGSGVGGGAGTGVGGAAPAQPAEPAVRTLAAEPTRAEPTPTAGAGGAGAAAGGSGSGARGVAGAPFMPMGMGAGGAARDTEHRTKSPITVDPTELFGKPSKTAPPVIGED